MDKLNNKGFAFSTILYGLLLVSIMIIFMVMALMSTNRVNNKSLVDQVERELNSYSLTEYTFNGNADYSVSINGNYMIELWGAAGGSGNGSYSRGIFYLDSNTKVSFNFESGGVRASGGGVNLFAAANNGTNSSSSGSGNMTLSKVWGSNAKAHISYLGETFSEHNFTNKKEGTYYIKASGSSSYFLTNDNGTVRNRLFTGNDNQKWEVRRISNSENGNVNDNYYIIISGLDGRIMQLRDVKGTDGTGIIVKEEEGIFYNDKTENGNGWERTFDTLEKWSFEPDGGSFKIKSGLILDDILNPDYDNYDKYLGLSNNNANTNSDLHIQNKTTDADRIDIQRFDFISTY